MKLSKLSINAFRGISNPLMINFNPSKKITLLYGQNGNGKTSIIDAMACLLTDHWGSVEEKSFEQSEYSSSIIAKGKSKSDVRIELMTDDGNSFAATFNGSNFIKKGTAPVHCNTLYRAQLSKLIDNTPSERYKQIGDYLDLDNIIKAEETLGNLIKSLKIDIEKCIAIVSDNDKQIRDVFESIPNQNLSLEQWKDSILNRDINDESKKLQSLKSVLNAYESLVQRKKDDVVKYQDYVKISENLVDAKTKLDNAISQKSNLELIDILESTVKYLSANSEDDLCPVCHKSDFDSVGINRRILSQLDTLKGQKILQDEYRKFIDIEKQANAIVQQALNEAEQKIEEIRTYLTDIDLLFDDQAFDDSLLSIDHSTNPILIRFKKIYAPLKHHQEYIDTLKIKADQLEQAIDGHAKILLAINNHDENFVKLKKFEKVQIKARAALDIIRAERLHYTDQVLGSISDEVNRLYALIHPGENIGNLYLFMKDGFKGSLYLNANFYGDNISPQATYSESHLDTLGLCIFIALAKLNGPANTVLILDDVLTSVDEDHLDRTIEMLHNESGNFAYLIMTTHYRSWFHKYKFGRADRESIQIIELRDWSIENGVSIANFRSDIEDLKFYLEPSKFDRQVVASKSGILAESILTHLSLLYQCKLPHKSDNRYTLSELISGFSKKLKPLMKTEILNSSNSYDEFLLSDNLNQLQAFIDVRNGTGAHFNPVNDITSDSDVKEFANICLTLAYAVHCPKSGKMPDKKPTGSYWQSSNDTIRLHPLTEPKD